MDTDIRAGKRDRSRKNKASAKTTAKEPGMGAEPLSSKDYDKHLARLQGELVQLQLWVQDKGRRSASCSRAATAPAKAARSRRLRNAPARGFSAWWRCRRLQSVRKARCMYSAICRICRPPGKS